MLGSCEITGGLKKLMLTMHIHPSCLAIYPSRRQCRIKGHRTTLGIVYLEKSSNTTTFGAQQHCENAPGATVASECHLNYFASGNLLSSKLIEDPVRVASRLLQVDRGNMMIATDFPTDTICHRTVVATPTPLLGKRADSASCR